MNQIIRKILIYINNHPMDAGAYRDALAGMQTYIEQGKTEYHAVNKKLRENQLAKALIRSNSRSDIEAFGRLNKTSLLMDATVDFDAYMLFVEYERDPDKRFYLPRRNTLHGLAADLQALDAGDLDLLTISLPPGVGKSTLAIFFLSWIGGKHPELPSLSSSHSNSFLRGVYDEILRIVRPGEYLWSEVFPKVALAGTNANDLRIDLGESKRFETLEFSSIASGNAGKVRAGKLLYCDDLVEGIEQALSKDRMDKLWNQYVTDLRQRKIGNCGELHIATRWSIYDPIGRLQREYEDHPEMGKAKFVAIPALNEKDESNFNYPIAAGFTTSFYLNQREIMEDADWLALYMNEPIERKGQLYPENELRRFFELPDVEPDAIVSICDTKDKGKDYAFLPVAFVLGADWYVFDCICDNGEPKAVNERIAQCLVKDKVQLSRFESNNGGTQIAENVQRRVKELGGITHITTKTTLLNKETKIIANSPWVKDHVLFLDKSKYRRNSDYGRMMNFLTTWTMAGHNAHDDVPDGMAMLAQFAQNLTSGRVEVFQRPF